VFEVSGASYLSISEDKLMDKHVFCSFLCGEGGQGNNYPCFAILQIALKILQFKSLFIKTFVITTFS